MAEEQIKIEISLDGSNVEKTFGQLANSASKNGVTIGNAIGDGISGSLGIALSGINAALEITGSIARGVSSAFGFFTNAANAAALQEQAVQSLNIALANSGQYSAEASTQMQNFASKLQSATAIGDEVTLKVAAQVQSIVGTNAATLERLVTAAADASAATGKNFEATSEKIAKATLGETGALKDLGIVYKSTGDRAKDMENILGLVESRFAGSAEKSAQNYAGSLRGVQAAFGDVIEKVGMFFTQSPVLIKLMNLIQQGFEVAQVRIQEFFNKGNIVDVFIVKLAELGEGIVTYVIKPLEVVAGIGQAVFSGIVLGINGVIAGFGALGGKIGELLSFVGIENSATEGLRNFAESSKAVLNDSFADFKIDVFNVGDTSVSDTLLTTVTDVKAQLTEVMGTEPLVPVFPSQEKLLEQGEMVAATAATASAGVKAATDDLPLTFTNIAGSFAKAAQSMKLTAVDVAKALMTGFGNGVANAFSAFGTALANGDNAMKAFAVSMLKTIGQIAVQLGTSFILQGVAHSLNPLTPGLGLPLIAAGAALVTFGAAFSALVGGGAASGGAAGGGGGSPFNDDPLDTRQGGGIPEFNNPELAEEERMAGSKVEVNIQGDVLDSSETGLRIVQLINDAFDEKGARVT